MTKDEFIQNDLAIKIAELSLANAVLKAEIEIMKQESQQLTQKE